MTREPSGRRRDRRLWGPDPARDVEDEFGFHVQERIDELVARGMEYRAAREEALQAHRAGLTEPWPDDEHGAA